MIWYDFLLYIWLWGYSLWSLNSQKIILLSGRHSGRYFCPLILEAEWRHLAKRLKIWVCFLEKGNILEEKRTEDSVSMGHETWRLFFKMWTSEFGDGTLILHVFIKADKLNERKHFISQLNSSRRHCVYHELLLAY